MLNIPALFVYLLATAVGWIIGKCSRSFLRKTAVLFGNVMYIFPCFGKLCLENVMAAFPEKSREEAFFRAYGSGIFLDQTESG